MNTSALGRHILIEFQGCNPDKLNDIPSIEQAFLDAAAAMNATVVNTTFHHFSPQGVSGVVVIQESHLAIHTWPEHEFAAIDIFTCGETVNPWKAYDFLKAFFQPTNSNAMEINRGSKDLLKR